MQKLHFVAQGAALSKVYGVSIARRGFGLRLACRLSVRNCRSAQKPLPPQRDAVKRTAISYLKRVAVRWGARTHRSSGGSAGH